MQKLCWTENALIIVMLVIGYVADTAVHSHTSSPVTNKKFLQIDVTVFNQQLATL